MKRKILMCLIAVMSATIISTCYAGKLDTSDFDKEQLEGEELNLKGLYIIDDDGNSKEVTNDMVSDYDSSLLGSQTITITDGNDTYTTNVKVGQDGPKQINVKGVTTKYCVGDEFDNDGKIVVTYKSGKKEEVKLKEEYINFSTSSEGKKTVTVRYLGLSCEYEIQVEKVDLSITARVGNESDFVQETAIRVRVYGDLDYGELPNNDGRFKKKDFTYLVKENGSYTFKAYDTHNQSESVTIQIKNIDNEAPEFKYSNNEISLSDKASGVDRITSPSGKDYSKDSLPIKNPEKGKWVGYDRAGNKAEYNVGGIRRTEKVSSYSTVPLVNNKEVESVISNDWITFYADEGSKITYKEKKNKFEDTNTWAKNVIDMVYARGLMVGVSDTEFKPNEKVNKAMVTAVLYRMYGTDSGISDMYKDKWYKKEATWYDSIDPSFLDNYEIELTREEIAHIVNRVMKLGSSNTNTSLTDIENSDYKLDIKALYEKGIMTGYDGHTFKPTQKVTRAEFASILVQILRHRIEL